MGTYIFYVICYGEDGSVLCNIFCILKKNRSHVYKNILSNCSVCFFFIDCKQQLQWKVKQLNKCFIANIFNICIVKHFICEDTQTAQILDCSSSDKDITVFIFKRGTEKKYISLLYDKIHENLMI